MRVDQIMTKTVETIRHDATIGEAVGRLVKLHISGLPVVDATGRLVGMLTEGDLLRRVELGTQRPHKDRPGLFGGRDRAIHEEAVDYVRNRAQRVSDVMTRNPIFVHESTPLVDAVALMEEHHVRRLPVTTLGGLVGILSRSDLVRHLHHLISGTAMLRRTDAEIRHDILTELDKQAWYHACRIGLAVHEGHVRFAGTLKDRAFATALRVAAETVPGVVSVRVPVVV